MNTVNAKNRLVASAKARSILRAADGVRLKSSAARDISWLVDLKALLADGETLDLIAHEFWERFGDEMPFQLAGLEFSAVPIIAAILMAGRSRGQNPNAIYIRKERKKSGAGRNYEGVLNGHSVILIDDIINTGGSLERAAVVLENEGISPKHAFVILNFGNASGLAWQNRRQLSLTSLLRLDDLGLAQSASKPVPAYLEMPLRWNWREQDPNFYHRVPKSTPLVNDDLVYFGTDAGRLLAFDLENGSRLWEFEVRSRGHKNIWSSPCQANGAVIFGSYDGNVYSLDKRTGKEIWRTSLGDWIGSSPALSQDGDSFYIGVEHATSHIRGGLACLDTQSGEPLWEQSSSGLVHSSPALSVDGRFVAYGNNDNELTLVDSISGRMIWKFCAPGVGAMKHAPAFNPVLNEVSIGSTDGKLYNVDVSTGMLSWFLIFDNSIFSTPIVSGNNLYIGCNDKHYYCIDALARAVLWKVYVGGRAFSSGSLFEGSVWVGSTSGQLFLLEQKTGKVVATRKFANAITNRPVIDQTSRSIVISTSMNEIFAFSLPKFNFAAI